MDDFAATHKQCQHCGSYFPADEAQYFEGMLLCPACIGALEEEEREKEEKREEDARKPEAGGESSSTEGICDRCGRPAGAFYMLGGKKLCRICYEASEADSFSRGPGGTATPIRITKVEKEKGLLGKLIDLITGKEEEKYGPVELEPLQEGLQTSKPKKQKEGRG
jgi:ribosomal protein S14